MRKQTLLVTLLAGSIFACSAQTSDTTTAFKLPSLPPLQKGNWMVGGSIGSMGYSFEGKSFNVQLNPRSGYFISEGLAIGAQASLGLITARRGSNQWNYGIAPFIRYYIPTVGSSTGRLFTQGDVGIAGSSIGSDVSLAMAANVGYSQFITPTVAFETMLGYNYSKANINLGQKSSGLGISLGLQIHLPGNYQ